MHETPRPEALGVAVIGRVMSGAVRVGDVFTEAEGPRVGWNEPSDRTVDVSLTVHEVRVFRQLTDEADPPFAAELLVTGHGIEHLGDLVMLRHTER